MHPENIEITVVHAVELKDEKMDKEKTHEETKVEIQKSYKDDSIVGYPQEDVGIKHSYEQTEDTQNDMEREK